MLCAITAAAQSEKGFPVCQDRGLTRSEAGAVHRSQRCRRKRPANSYDNFVESSVVKGWMAQREKTVDRYRKKDILRTVELLNRANESICSARTKESSVIMEAFTQCQESAIRIGTILEELNGDYEQMVHMLEDYCEMIYQMSMNFHNENTCRKLSKKSESSWRN